MRKSRRKRLGFSILTKCKVVAACCLLLGHIFGNYKLIDELRHVCGSALKVSVNLVVDIPKEAVDFWQALAFGYDLRIYKAAIGSDPVEVVEKSLFCCWEQATEVLEFDYIQKDLGRGRNFTVVHSLQHSHIKSVF